MPEHSLAKELFHAEMQNLALYTHDFITECCLHFILLADNPALKGMQTNLIVVQGS